MKYTGIFGVEFNNAIFGFVEKENLTDIEKKEMIQSAHAAVLHWQKFSKSTIANSQRGYYMLAKAYVKAREKENALKYANLCFEITTKNEDKLLDWDLAYAYEMKARTAAMNNDKETFKKFYKMAKEQEVIIKDPEDLKYFSLDFKDGDWFRFA
jgi:hypothetical protein